MTWPLHHKKETSYWLKVFALYVLIEAFIQLLFFFILKNFGTRRISIIEFHLVMWVFQCWLIWPIWWVARVSGKKPIAVQILINIVFYIAYSVCWFGPIQEAIGFLYHQLQQITRPVNDRQIPYLDRGADYAYINFQLLKHSFRLSWFYMAVYFYNYRLEENKRIELAVANKELQLKLLKWHLNPSFYFKTINHLCRVAADKPINTAGPILQLAKVMEYVIYEAKEKLIAVKKEIQFLHHYIELVNQQAGSNVKYTIRISGEYEKLKIAPLILAGFIDNMTAGNHTVDNILYTFDLQFSGIDMQLAANRNDGKMVNGLLSANDDLPKILNELYPGRFSFGNVADKNQCTLFIKLDEER